MARKPLIINVVQIETAEVGLDALRSVVGLQGDLVDVVAAGGDWTRYL
jgi:hypothetical protein